MWRYNMWYILIIILIIVIIWFVYVLNRFIYLKKRIERSKSVIDVFLKERFDLIPNLVESCKGYLNYEKETLSKIVELRTDFAKNNNQKSGEKLNKYYKELIGIFENYPELKANETILILQKQLEKLESEIAAARRIYVNDITSYNTLVRKIPSNLVAKIFKYQEINYPILETEEIKIKF